MRLTTSALVASTAAACLALPGITSEPTWTPPPEKPDLTDPTGSARTRGKGCNPVLSLGHGSLDSIVPAGEHISDMGGITVHIHQCVFGGRGISEAGGIVGSEA